MNQFDNLGFPQHWANKITMIMMLVTSNLHKTVKGAVDNMSKGKKSHLITYTELDLPECTTELEKKQI